MGEVVVAATFKVRAGAEEEAEGIIRDVVRETHAEEGCITYALHRGLDDPGRFVLVERWRSREDLDAHFQQPYVARMAEAADLLEEPPGTWFVEALPEGDGAKGRL